MQHPFSSDKICPTVLGLGYLERKIRLSPQGSCGRMGVGGGQSGDEEMLAEVMCGKVCENGEAKWGGGGRYEQRHLLQSYFTPV